jgi:hypothetical protein
MHKILKDYVMDKDGCFGVDACSLPLPKLDSYIIDFFMLSPKDEKVETHLHLHEDLLCI